MPKRYRIILIIIIVFLIVIVWGFLSGNMTLEFSTTKVNHVGQDTSEEESETIPKETEERLTGEETTEPVDETFQEEVVTYYPTEEALIAGETKDIAEYFIVYGDDTLLVFLEKNTNEIGSFDVLTCAKDENGYYPYGQKNMKVTIKNGVTIQVSRGEYYIWFFNDNGREVEDNLEEDFMRIPVAENVELFAKYISCPLEEYELYMDGDPVDLSDAYDLQDKNTEDIPYYHLEDYILALGLSEKYLSVQGNSTILFVEDDSLDDEDSSLHISYAAMRKVDGVYYEEKNVDNIQITKRDMIIKVQGEYYMMYIRLPEDETKIWDNSGEAFQEMEVSHNTIIGVKYISCPIAEYEYYIDGWKLDLSPLYN